MPLTLGFRATRRASCGVATLASRSLQSLAESIMSCQVVSCQDEIIWGNGGAVWLTYSSP